MTVVDDAERVARAELLRIAEPGHVALAAHVNRVGVVQCLADIRAGASVPDVEVDAMRPRLRHASGVADLEAAAAVGARLVCPGDEEWPRALDDLEAVQLGCHGLWVRGTARLSDVTGRAVAIVGTRAATDYGIHVAHDMAEGLADRDWTVVSGLASGLAYGIDTAAHRGALAGGGVTIAVLACGVDKPYPPGNRTLYEGIATSGLVVSEHPPGSAPQRHRFLVRNRIIAALAQGTVVVEMAPRSGAKSTALHADRLNRYVMAVPGPVTSAMSVGCHQLLRERPHVVLVTRADEVIEQCGHLGELALLEVSLPRPRDLLGPIAARAFDGVPVFRPAASPSIAATAGLSQAQAEAALAALATQGWVERTDEGQWVMTSRGRQQRRAGQPAEGDWW
jgi:DNA processing protein